MKSIYQQCLKRQKQVDILANEAIFGHAVMATPIFKDKPTNLTDDIKPLILAKHTDCFELERKSKKGLKIDLTSK